MRNANAKRLICLALCALLMLSTFVSAENIESSNFTELKYGLKNNAGVELMQSRLRQLGYLNSSSTGNYFEATTQAVAEFQVAAGLSVNGKVASPEMQALLFSDDAPVKNGSAVVTATPAPTPSGAGESGELSQLTYGMCGSAAVTRMQDRLRELGYLKCSSTGGYYTATCAAVEAFQKAAGLAVNKKTASVEMLTLLYSASAPAYGATAAPTTAPTTAPTINPPQEDVTPSPVPTSPASGYTQLVANTSGDAVKAMQTRLRALGYMTANATGGYYSATIAAVEAFQKAAGLPVNGKVATVEMQALLFSADAPNAYDAAAEYSALTYGMTGSDQVRLMQRRLAALGYFTSTATGNYYSATGRAVANFQAAVGLKEDSKTASVEMLKILYSSSAPAKGESYQPTATPTPSPTPEPTPTPAPGEGETATPEPTPTPVVYSDLKYGMSGSSAVRAMQDRLRELGYMSCNSTGGYYTQTVKAVAAFQKAIYFAENGRLADAEMQKILFSDAAPVYGSMLITSSPAPGETPGPSADPTLPPADNYAKLTYGLSNNAAVKAAQTRLKALGFMSCEPTGNYYSLTAAAAKKFQAYAGLSVDGNTISVEMQQLLFYEGDLDALIAEREQEKENKYQNAQTDILLKSGSVSEQVTLLTTRLIELGYMTGSPVNTYGSAVVEAVKWFQNCNNLAADGIAGPATLSLIYTSAALDAASSMEGKPGTTPGEVSGTPYKPSIGSVLNVDFFSSAGDKYFNRKTGTFKDGAYAIVTDIATGICYRVKRVGGYNHADVEPVTAFDTWQMYRIYGFEWAWTRHAVFVTLSDGTTLAGSINGMPHGTGHIADNNMDGHTCIHFLNSRTHGSDKVDPAHQAAISKAASASVSAVQARINAQ